MKSTVRNWLMVFLTTGIFAQTVAAQPIYLNAGVIDTATTVPRKAVAGTTGDQLHLVQFDGPIQPEWVAQLEAAGWRIVDFVPDNTYIVYGGKSARKMLRAQVSHVQWEGAFLPSDKIQPRATPAALKQRKLTKPDSKLFAVQLVEDAAANAATIAWLEEAAGEPLASIATNETLRFVNIRVALPENRIEELAGRQDVLVIDVYEPPQRRGERQGQIVAGNVNAAGSQPTGPGYLSWITSKGFTQAQFDASGMVIDIADDGWDRGVAANPANREFRVDGDAAKSSRVKYSRTASKLTEANSAGTDGHGNINISIIGGYNNSSGNPYTDADGYHRGLGINPFALMGNTKVFKDGGSWDPTEAQEKIFIATNYHSGVRISSDSWGLDGDGEYNVDAQNYDTWTRDSQPGVSGNQQVLYVFAAGNDGPGSKTIGAPGTGKNIFSIGASENYNMFGTDGCAVGNTGANNANDIIDFSSRGPCKDSRKKPDIVAPGTHVAGAASFANGYTGEGVCDKYQPAGQTNYAASSGTSHSTPAVAGGASLVYQYFINQGWTIPSPAMMKAYLMNSTRYLTGVDANDTLPSNNQGMGLMNLGTAFDGTQRMLRDQLTNDIFTASGQTRTFFANVVETNKPLRITLGWTDAPGSLSGNAYKNNLDLTVLVGGQTYLGNSFAGAFTTPGGTADPRNNVESVFLPAGQSGLITIKVTAANINSDGVPGYGGALDQDFVLVAYNAEEYIPSNYPPVLEPIGNKAMATNRLMQFTVTASDPVDGDSVRLWATGIPAWATFAGATNAGTASAQFSGTTPETTGTYNVAFYAADKDGTNTESIVIVVNDINCVPAVLLSEDFDDSTGVPTGWVNSGSANDTSATHYKSSPNCRGFGAGASLETPPINTPTQIVFYVDASGNGAGKTATLDYKIGSGEWKKVGNFIATTAGKTETFDLTSSPDLREQANVSFRFSSTFSTWYLDDVIISGMDCGGGFLPNNPPTIGVEGVGGTNKAGSVGVELSFTVTANDADSDNVSLQATSLPVGATFATASGPAPVQSTFTWTPGSTGKYSAVFTANDGKATATQAVSITVSAFVAPLLAPEIQVPSAVLANQFNANWSAVSNATGYRLDVSDSPSFSGGGGGLVLAEDFAGVTVSNANDISASLDTYTLVPGWTGAKIYPEMGWIKLGSASAKGYITTPTLDLSGNGGVATLTFELAKYGTDATTVQVLHAPDGSNFTQVGSDLTAPSSKTLQTIQINDGTANSKIQISAKGLSKSRFYLDNIQVEGGGGAGNFVPGYQNRDVGNVTTYAVTGLAENVTYYYRARAYDASRNSDYSATTNVTTTAGVDIPPVLNPIGNKTVALGGSLQFAITAVPTDGDEVTLTTSALPAGATFGSTNENGTFQWNNASPTGVYSVTFYAEDVDGQDSETITITVYDPEAELQAPVVQAASSVQAQQFNANWLASVGAVGYRLDVATDDSFTAGGGGGGGGAVLSEDFAGFTAVDGTQDRSGSLNTYLQTPGWTGSKVYEDAGRAKLGSSSALGYIVTPTVDLSGNGGNATLTFDLGQYGTDVGSIQVQHAPDGSTFSPIGSDLTPPASMTSQSIPITGGTANSKIKFTAKVASKNRFRLDNVEITAGSGGGGGSGSFVAGYEDRDVGNVTTFAVTGLTESITYYYRVRAYDASTNSGYSATTNVTTVAAPALQPPVIQAASGVQAEQFNANWLASVGATGYRLDVGTNETFSGGGGGPSERLLLATNAASSASIQTDGWSATDTGGSTYVQMAKPTATILSPAFSTVGFTNLTVDMMARTYNGVNATYNIITVSVSTNNGTAWDTLGTVLPLSSTMANMGTLTDATHIGHAETRLRWQTLGANGTIGAGVQQLHIRGWTAGGGVAAAYVPGYENRDVGNVTTFAVTGLVEGVTYYYRVRAYNASTTTVHSAVTSVVTSASTPTQPEFDTFTFPPNATPAATFASQAGITYQLQYTTDLLANPPVWTAADTEVGTGGNVTLEDTNAVDSRRYYRIVIP
ncbi:MAG TPA: S8 family serine peptidase [Kiritimatiellia bacterium]|nr:S8 family serine peptidase [Kiritimatiellia bacterium]HQG75079.1 S8 family serine peptidase [Kiritimatiellia bacterium]